MFKNFLRRIAGSQTLGQLNELERDLDYANRNGRVEPDDVLIIMQLIARVKEGVTYDS